MNGEINPCRELIVNNAERTEPLMTQMEQWSILSNILNYIQHSKFNSMDHYMDIFEGIHSDIGSSNRFDENSDTSTTYLGRIENKGSQDKLKQKNHFLYQKVATLWVDY